MLLLAMLAGCASGWFNGADWSGPLSTALYIMEPSEDPSVEAAVVLLANSRVHCDLPVTGDPAELRRAIIGRYAAISREGARVVALSLYRFTSATWEGDYEISADAGPWQATASLGAATASYLAVGEAEVDDDDGFDVRYEPAAGDGNYIFESAVEGPGNVHIRSAGRRLRGDFEIEDKHVSGRFHAEPCDADADLFSTQGFSPNTTEVFE